ncbi:MAG TPA: TVP38/TMEM64 family protein [Coriobacteriia bacterium]|nr:TVP38/TMEM64 family protein [Coriobacteriia bacterium]
MRKAIVLIAVIAAVLSAAYLTGLAEQLTDVLSMRRYFQELGWPGYLVFILISIVVAVFLLPGQFLAIIAGVTYGGALGGLLTVVGATVGSCLSFLIGRYCVRDMVVRRFASNPVFQKIEAGIRENGVSFLILTRLVPVFPYAIQSYAYALTPMRVGTFTLVSFITMIPASFIYASLASEIVVNGFSPILMLELALAGIVLFLLSFIPRSVAKRRNIRLG